jgi:hypothetical protein
MENTKLQLAQGVDEEEEEEEEEEMRMVGLLYFIRHSTV